MFNNLQKRKSNIFIKIRIIFNKFIIYARKNIPIMFMKFNFFLNYRLNKYYKAPFLHSQSETINEDRFSY